jgi:hypothetical protein
MVMGMRGYMQGVKLTRTPPIYDAAKDRRTDPFKYRSRLLVRFSSTELSPVQQPGKIDSAV